MKRLMMTMVVVVVLMGIPGKALAQSRWLDWCFTRRSCGGYGYSRYSYMGTPARSRWLNWTFTRGRYGGYGYYGSDRTLRRVTGYGGLAMNVLHGIDQISTNDRVLKMAEREQAFRHQQIRIQNNR